MKTTAAKIFSSPGSIVTIPNGSALNTNPEYNQAPMIRIRIDDGIKTLGLSANLE